MTSFSISEKCPGQRSVHPLCFTTLTHSPLQWSFLESNTRSPYILSLKSNGCIIFIGALTPSKLVITSKHSLGPVAGQTQAHAQVGETWVKRYLDQKGRTEADLARQLWDNNWTAIAEVRVFAIAFAHLRLSI